MPNPSEIAQLIIDGTIYQDWETVYVRHALREAPPYVCRFTCSEGHPLPVRWAELQIMPGDRCTVILGGILAFTGLVNTRQVYYDANRHHIEIICANPLQTMTSSVIHETGEWNNKTVEQIARPVLKKVGLNLVVEGGALPAKPIPRFSSIVGETVHEFMDRLTRRVSTETSIGVSFTSNHAGDFVIVVGPAGGQDAVIEGQNILEGREIIYSPQMAKVIPSVSQAPKKDGQTEAQVSQQLAAKSMGQVLGTGVPPFVVSNDVPGWNPEFNQNRAGVERNWLGEDMVTVWATVYGWMRPSGGLWYRDQIVTVKSPMLVMNGVPLTAKSVTFTQDDHEGTRTTLELCNALALGQFIPRAS